MFIDTIPILIGEGAMFGLAEFLLVFVALFAVFYISAPFDDRDATVTLESAGDWYYYLYACWLGQSTLGRVFWPFFLIFNAGLIAADYWVWNGFISVSSWWNIHIILLAPFVWWAVSIWRSPGRRVLLAMSRLVVCAALFEFGFRGYIYWQVPRLFFNCEELLLDYFSCF